MLQTKNKGSMKYYCFPVLNRLAAECETAMEKKVFSNMMSSQVDTEQCGRVLCRSVASL
jgi:hypothetical protein